MLRRDGNYSALISPPRLITHPRIQDKMRIDQMTSQITHSRSTTARKADSMGRSFAGMGRGCSERGTAVEGGIGKAISRFSSSLASASRVSWGACVFYSWVFVALLTTGIFSYYSATTSPLDWQNSWTTTSLLACSQKGEEAGLGTTTRPESSNSTYMLAVGSQTDVRRSILACSSPAFSHSSYLQISKKRRTCWGVVKTAMQFSRRAAALLGESRTSKTSDLRSKQAPLFTYLMSSSQDSRSSMRTKSAPSLRAIHLGVYLCMIERAVQQVRLERISSDKV